MRVHRCSATHSFGQHGRNTAQAPVAVIVAS
jgi:hypothetical protein